MSEMLSLLIAGDCGPTHGPAKGFPIEGYTELVLPTLAQADMRFVNCMRTYSTRAVRTDHAPQVGQPIEMADIFTNGRFDAVTLSNNHSYDSGPDALVDTRELFISRGIQVTGAGKNLAEARQAAIIERDGVKVGYLGYTTVGKPEATARADKPGVTNMRIKTLYETRGPHESVRIHTEVDPDDLAMLVEDVAKLRKVVDVVILAFHAGVIRIPRVISDYQVSVAHAAIDAGADMVVGHSPHIPKAIEVYKGKSIFYSIGVFAMTKSFAAPSWTSDPAWAQGAVRNHTDLDPTFPFMPYGEDCTMALLAKARFSSKGIVQTSFLPMVFDDRYRPRVLRRSDPDFERVLAYMEWASEDMPHRFNVEGDEVIVSAS